MQKHIRIFTVVRDQVDGQTTVTESSALPNEVDVSVRRLKEIKVDDHVEDVNINPVNEDVGANKVAAFPLAGVMETRLRSSWPICP